MAASSTPPVQEKGGEAGATGSDLPIGWMLRSSSGRKLPWQHQPATSPFPSSLGHISGLESPSWRLPLPLRPNLLEGSMVGGNPQLVPQPSSPPPVLNRGEMEVVVCATLRMGSYPFPARQILAGGVRVSVPPQHPQAPGMTTLKSHPPS